MKDFKGQNLRGRNFKGQDLIGADFSGADIRGAKFTDAILKGANFTEAKAGLQRHWAIFQAVVAFVLSGLLNFVSVMFNGVIIGSLLEGIKQYTVFPALAALFMLGVVYFAIARQGLTTKAFGTILICIAFTFMVGISFASIITLTGAVELATSAIFAFTGAIAFVFAAMFMFAVTFIFSGAGAVTGVFVGAFTVAGGIIFAGATAATVEVTFAVVVATVLLTIYEAWRVSREDEKFASARNFGLVFGALGGTNFQGADLTEATFSGALLKNTNFANSRRQKTILTRVCWKKAKRLDLAQVGDSVLSVRRVRELLVTGKGINQTFESANLRGANLNKAQLNGAILKRADLGEATLFGADLQNAILTEVQAIATDFTGAYLTGTCIEAWNIDRSTCLKDVDCEFIFLREHPDEKGNRDRRPHDPDRLFAEGEFEQRYQEAIDIIEVLLKDGMRNGKAFHQALATVMQAHPEITPESIQKIERKGDDALVTFEVPKHVEVDKGAIERELQQAYEEVRQLRGKVEELQTLRAADVREIALAALKQQNIFYQIAGDQTMTESSKTNNFNGSMSGVIGSDNAQVNNNTFNQINNANTTELLQLIAKLRETATTFPEETQDAILIDLEDIETEIQKPEATRNPKKIKQRLMAILATAGVVATGVAGVTDFANTAIDLGSKLGIELQLPSAP